jgi:O-antigen/teichoic acid export membrane protein
VKANKKNFIAVNINKVILLTISLISVGLLIRALGTEIYTHIAILVSFISFFNLFGNSIVDVCIKEVISNEKDNSFLSKYLSSALMLIFLLVLFLLVIATTASFFIEINFFGNHSLFFILIFIILLGINLYIGVFRVGSFSKEEFLYPSIYSSTSKIVYLLSLILCLQLLSAGLWSIPLSNLFSSIVLLSLMFMNCKKHLPDISFQFNLADINTVKSILHKVGFMVLVYIGIYLNGNALLLAGKFFEVSTVDLFAVAISLSIGSMIVQFFSSFAFITTPKIHKLVKEKNKNASLIVQINSSIILVCTAAAITLFSLNGQVLLAIWTGKEFSNESLVIILGFIFSFGVSVVGIPISHYCIAIGKLKAFGLSSLCVGLLSVLLSCVYYVSFTSNIATILASFTPGILCLANYIHVKAFVSKVHGYNFDKIYKIVINIALLPIIMIALDIAFANNHWLIKIILAVLPILYFLFWALKKLEVK